MVVIYKKISILFPGVLKNGSTRLVRGQVMLMTVLIISGTILGATTIAGLITLNQIRQSANVSDSAKAIYAADTGIEYELFRIFKTDKYGTCVLRTCLPDYSVNNSLVNGASFTATVPEDASYIESIGNVANKVFRAFRTDL